MSDNRPHQEHGFGFGKDGEEMTDEERDNAIWMLTGFMKSAQNEEPLPQIEDLPPTTKKGDQS